LQLELTDHPWSPEFYSNDGTIGRSILEIRENVGRTRCRRGITGRLPD